MNMDLPCAFGERVGEGIIRQQPEDFRVIEQLGFSLSGEGEHYCCFIRKTGWNTEDVALWLARHAGVPRGRVGFSGLKDRNAVTDQWFSVHLPGKPDPQMDALPDGLELLAQYRHKRKLNRGSHQQNEFRIRIRHCTGEQSLWDERLQKIRTDGVPNYFGVQRFGRGGQNWDRGLAWLRGEGEAPRKKSLRGFWLSAVRSGLFNLLLAERVRQGNWHHLVEGDWLQPDGKRGIFPGSEDASARQRVQRAEVHPALPLPGKGGGQTTALAKELEQSVWSSYGDVITALECEGVKEERRASRLLPQSLQWEWQTQSGVPVLALFFSLPKGAFATTVLSELCLWE